MKRVILFFAFSILLNLTFQAEEDVIFTIKGIDPDQECSTAKKKYNFNILGFIDSTCKDSSPFSLDLEGKKEAKCEFFCEDPTRLSCYINIESYPLINEKVVIKETDAPQVSGFVFSNWDNFIETEENRTIGEDITCQSEPTNDLAFIAESIKFNGGCIWKNTSFTVSVNLTRGTMGDDFYFNLPLSLPKKTAYCRAHQDNKKYFFYCNSEVNNELLYLGKFDGYDTNHTIHISFSGNDIHEMAPNCNKANKIMINTLLLFGLIVLIL